jgi:hypothetical protein
VATQLLSEPLLDADKRALTSSAETEERVQQESVEVGFEDPAAAAERSETAEVDR